MRDLTELLEEVGFTTVLYEGETPFSTSRYTVGALFKAVKKAI